MLKSILFLLCASPALAASSQDFFSDIDQFLSSSQVRRAQVSRMEASSAQLLSKSLQILTPAVDLSATKSWVEGHNAGDFLKATASWNLFRGGSDAFAWRSATAAKESLQWQQLGQDQQLELRAAKLIFQNLYLKEETQAQRELLKMKEESLRIGRVRYQQGRIPMQEVSKMELDLSQQQIHLRELELNTIENEAEFKALFVDELKTNTWPFDEKTKVANKTQSGSPQVKSLVLRAEASRLNWHSRQSLHFPSLDLSFSYQRTPLKSLDSHEWNSILSLSFPLWSQGQISANSADAYASFREAYAESEQAQREEDIKQDLWKKKISSARENLVESRSNLQRSEVLYRDMLKGFQVGRLSTNDLFTEQARKVQGLSSVAQAKWHFHQILAESCVFNGLRLMDCLKSL